MHSEPGRSKSSNTSGRLCSLSVKMVKLFQLVIAQGRAERNMSLKFLTEIHPLTITYATRCLGIYAQGIDSRGGIEAMLDLVGCYPFCQVIICENKAYELKGGQLRSMR